MKAGDYQTPKQANQYLNKRFDGGLSKVAVDEALILREFLKKAGLDEPTSLDLGTGTGRVVKELLKFNPKQIYALDASVSMLKVFKNVFSKEVSAGLIKTILSTSDKIMLKEKSIDIVTIFHLFKHLPKAEPTLIEVNRVLKSACFLIFDCLNKNSVIKFNLSTCYAYSEEEIKKILEKNGFKILELKHLHSLGETIYKLPFASPLAGLADFLTSGLNLKLGTKMLVLAQKIN